MSDVLNAYDQLIDIASRGETFTVDRVLYPPYPGLCQADTVFGSGFDIERTIAVPDVVEGRTVEATVKLRVIKTAASGLYLRTWLIWTPSDGQEHKSFASYEISREAAERLAGTETAVTMPDDLTEEQINKMSIVEVMEQVFSSISSALEDAVPYRAEWVQIIPGEDLDLDDETSYDFAERHYNYHEQVIDSLGGTDSPPTCMLSPMEIGEVGPQELVVLAQFVSSELDVSALV